ncbi:hypothetical protein [Amycolatopsis jiangsuensis]|uniref:Uncharacterized protein n=1 Tax=Amycolatopsis jiangsuensis TaxID=1181879 RepID=A0A840IML2_9PSEU|nr:hypothetical protein [Amycolatopsis jiangsuensis]MBB4683576.1 hypothetical protein [Amycolatopsis jiangsuensis]
MSPPRARRPGGSVSGTFTRTLISSSPKTVRHVGPESTAPPSTGAATGTLPMICDSGAKYRGISGQARDR